MIGFGLVVGPIIGSTLYSLFGFKGTFFVYGGFEVILGIIMRLTLPDRRHSPQKAGVALADERLLEQKDSEAKQEDELQKENSILSKETAAPGLGYCKLMGSARVSFAAAAAALQYFNYTIIEPILANRLVEKELTVM